jgi:putative addiction module component (TIGR02574 family)
MGIPGDLLAQALALPEQERGELIRLLLLSHEPEGPERDPGYDEAWQAELDARLEDVDRGNVAIGSLFEALDEIRKSLREKR